jgi:hypothetical protein
VNKNNEVGPWSATPASFFFVIRRHTQPARAPQNGDRERYFPPTRSFPFNKRKTLDQKTIISNKINQTIYINVWWNIALNWKLDYLGRWKCVIGSSPLWIWNKPWLRPAFRK